MIDLIGLPILIVVGLLQYALPRYFANWTGAIIVVPYLILVVTFYVTLGVNGYRDILIPVVGLFGLMGVWGQGVERKKAIKNKEEDEVDRVVR